ncbi:growth inhibitor PemK [Candidatus Pacearchaeota archaeon]|jgi:mRNA interferase MazF|nr:growth inhibitor PemK [Candidatus Pacearchaeota archaeon]|tara:strand:- start:543 stop:893 length:351 start_codon:yes stop_codon:yes gene_type:complete
MNSPKRGEIWLIDWHPARGSEQAGFRPSLVLQSDMGNSNDSYHNTIVVGVTTKGKDIPFHVLIESNSENGLYEKSFVKCEQILTVSKKRLVKRIGKVNNEVLDKVEVGVKLALSFD